MSPKKTSKWRSLCCRQHLCRLFCLPSTCYFQASRMLETYTHFSLTCHWRSCVLFARLQYSVIKLRETCVARRAAYAAQTVASWLPGCRVLLAPAGSAAPAAPSSPAPRGAAGHANSMLAAGPPLITRPARSSGSGWSKSGSGWSNSGSGWSNSGSGWSISGSGRSNSDHLVVDISLCRASNCAGKPPVSK